MFKEYFLALIMLISMILLLYILFTNRVFISKHKDDLSILFYGVNNKNDVSWQHAIFIFFIVFSVDSFFKKIFSKDDWFFFPKNESKNKPFGLFPNAYENNLKKFINKHDNWIRRYWILHLFFIFFATVLFLIYIFFY